jgi:tetratricopeptide (TPR) repeat protein
VAKDKDKAADPGKSKDQGKEGPPAPGEVITPRLAELSKDEKYEAALFRAIEHLARKEYADSLKALEEAQSHKDTGAVEREINKVRAILAQQEAAEKAARDIKSVLEDGKPSEAARLANEALGQFGGGDSAEALTRLQQQAEAEVTAGDDNKAARCAALRADAEAAERDGNLRAAAIALEQAEALLPDDASRARLDALRVRLASYDDNRRQASEWRRDPLTLDQALSRLKAAQASWDTLQVRQEIDELGLLLERRRDRLSVADFEVRGDFGVPAAGVTVAEAVLPHFRPRYDLVERGMLSKVADELKLEQSDLFEASAGRRELGRLARVRYLVVGSLSPLGGVTAQARLVELNTGVIVQTARVSAPTIEKLMPRLRDLAVMLQMDDAAKAAYEEKLIAAAAEVRPVAEVPLDRLPAPPPPPVLVVGAPPPPVTVVTFSPRPPVLGTLVVADLAPARLPPLLVVGAPPPPPPPALALVLRREDPRRNRLFALSLSLGDDLFRRGRYADAQRHFSLALTLGGPRQELMVRLDNCRAFEPPPPPVVAVPVPAFAPVAAPVAVPAIVPLRPRMVVFGFIPGRADLVPPRTTDLYADQLASYFAGRYEVVDRGEVSWFMGRLGLTVADVLNDPVSRRCLAESMGARYFTFTALAAGSIKLDSHVIDAQTNSRIGTASITAANADELKLRLGEVARQLGASPAERDAVAKQAAAANRAVTEARGHLDQARKLQSQKSPDLAGAGKAASRAAEVATTGLKDAPENPALLAIKSEAEKIARLASFEEARRKQAADLALAQEAARKRQQELAIQAAQARARAEADARARTEAQAREAQARREKAAEQLRNQARQAEKSGDHQAAARLLQSATSLKPTEAAYSELAKARLKADEDARARARDAEEKRLAAEKKARESAAARVEKDREARLLAEAERRKSTQAGDKALHDSYLKEATAALKSKKYDAAVAAAQAAQRLQATPEAASLLADAQHELALEKATEAEKKRLADVARKRADAEAAARKSREEYTKALTGAAADLKAGDLDSAIARYNAAAKLFPGDPAATSGLRAAQDIKKRKDDEARLAREAESRKKARLTELSSAAKAAEGKRDWATVVRSYREALTLAPGDVSLAAALAKAEKSRDDEAAAAKRASEEKTRKADAAKLIASGNALLKSKPAEAADAFRRALALDPTSAEARSGLAAAEKALPPPSDPAQKQRMEDYKLAMEGGEKALKARNYRGAMNSFREALRLLPGDAKAQAAFANAESLLRAETMSADKLAAYKKAYADGQALLKARKFAEALKAFDQALVAKPGDLDAIEGKRQAQEGMKPPTTDPRKVAYDKAMTSARALVKAGKHAEALRDFDEALKQMPGDKAAATERAAAVDTGYQAWYKQGQTLLAGKKFAEASRAFDSALALKPGDKLALEGKSQAEAGLKPPPDPKKTAYDKAMAAGKAALDKGDFAAAVAAYNDALKQFPKDALALKLRDEADAKHRAALYTAWMKQADGLLAQKKFAEAVTAYDNALKARPGDAAAIAGKKKAEAGLKPPPPDKGGLAEYRKQMASAQASEKGKKWPDAARSYQAAIDAISSDGKLTKELAAAYAGLGRAEHAQKRFDQAVKAYSESLRLAPGDKAVSEALSRARMKK